MIKSFSYEIVEFQNMQFRYYRQLNYLVKEDSFVSSEDELSRYTNHQNFDLSYEKYQLKIYNEIKPFLYGKILDFGCGKNPVLANLMNSEYYDLYFHQNKLATYDVIVMIEVIEHLHDINEISDINNRLNSNGRLIIKTNLLVDSIDLTKWWYLRDSTHYQFFSIKTFEFICSYFNLKIEFTNNLDLIVLKKND